MNDWFQETTYFLRKHYRSMHLLKAEIAGLEEAKKTIYEDYPQINWQNPKISNRNQPNDPTWRAVARLQTLEQKHIKSKIILEELEGTLKLLTPEERRIFNLYVKEKRSLRFIAKITGTTENATKKRLAGIYQKMMIGLVLTKQFESEDRANE